MAIITLEQPKSPAMSGPSLEDWQLGITTMIVAAKSLNVQDQASYDEITNLYSKARKAKAELESIRKKLIEPYRAKVADVNDKAKKLTAPVDEIIEIANAKAALYLESKAKSHQDDAEILRLEAELFGSPTAYVPVAPVETRGHGASASIKTEKSFRVIDLAQVPVKYLMIDEAAVKRDLKLGVGTISGIEIYETTKTTLRTR